MSELLTKQQLAEIRANLRGSNFILKKYYMEATLYSMLTIIMAMISGFSNRTTLALILL